MNKIENSGSPQAAAVFFEHAAAAILQMVDHPADMRGLVVVLPNYHVAVPLARALQRCAGIEALLLPQMVTFNDWAESVALPARIIPDACRATMLYQALRRGGWFQDADLWGIAHELLQLFDELTRHHVALPASSEEFLHLLESAYQARRNDSMQFEARIVHELWHAMSQGEEPDGARAYQLRLGLLARQASRPLCVLLTSGLSGIEQHFLRDYAELAPVTVLDLRQLASQQEKFAVLVHALGSAELRGTANGGATLREQAQLLRGQYAHAELGKRLRLFAAQGLEQEARAAGLQVRRWLLQGRKSIAIVAQDRLSARRVRALLEHAQVQVRDETGWILSTMAVSTVLMRWLDTLQDGFYYQDLLDLLKSPYVLSDLSTAQRKEQVFQLEQLIRKHGVKSHLQNFMQLAAEAPALLHTLQRVQEAEQLLAARKLVLGEWLQALETSLGMLGAVEALAADEAGKKLLLSLRQWQHELRQDTARFTRGEMRHWLALQLDQVTWRDTGIESPVLITHLAAARWRQFDAVLLLGCDEAHLPGAQSVSTWFNDAVRATLGLPVRAVQQEQQRDDLLCLLAMNDEVLATWQANRSGEVNLLSPYLEIVRSLHHLAYGDDLAEQELAGMLEVAQVRIQDEIAVPLAEMPHPALQPQHIPLDISASAYNSLLACPYQYFARHVLRLNELDEVRESIEKRDFGVWVHAILYQVFQQYPNITAIPDETLKESITAIQQEIFAGPLQHDYWAHAWLRRWQTSTMAWIDSQRGIEAEGWRFQAGEVTFNKPLNAQLQIRGRVDRIDVDEEENMRVLDYKTQAATLLRRKLKDAGEDVQLPFYAHAMGAAQAAYIGIDRDNVETVAPQQDFSWLMDATMQRLQQIFAQLHNGESLPANGIESVCAYCEMRGLCRKAQWHDE